MKKTYAPRQRRRATAACTACRRARIRCITESGSSHCAYCHRLGRECIFDDKDGRKCRSSVREVAGALTTRIHHLEQLLKDQQTSTDEAQRAAAVNSSAIDLVSSNDDPRLSPAEKAESEQDQGKEASDDDDDEERPSSVVHRLIPSPIRFDLASGRVRYLGPTTGMNLLSPASKKHATDHSGSRHRSHWPIHLIVRDLDRCTHDYLMDLFWRCHNSVIHLVHLDAFYLDKDRGGFEYYSTFLHLAMLATGLRYADGCRPGVRPLMGTSCSILHQKTRDMAKLEMDQPGGITTLQAYSLLGDLELSAGRDDTGWMYTGMSLRMVFDLGLHVDPAAATGLRKLQSRQPRTSLGVDLEMQIRHMVLWASLAYDKIWALHLGRPTSLKTCDIAPACLTFDFDRVLACKPAAHDKKVGTRIYESLLQLTHVIGSLCDLTLLTRSSREGPFSDESYCKMAAIDRRLNEWYRRLPSDLGWHAEAKAVMPPSYYLLHTQYHAALVLLHRPFIQYSDRLGSPSSSSSPRDTPCAHSRDSSPRRRPSTSSTFNTLVSRAVCVDNSRHITEILEAYHARFNMSEMFATTGLQHAGTAATAIMGEIVLLIGESRSEGRSGVDDLLANLGSLRLYMKHLAKTNPPANAMGRVVDCFLAGIRESSGGEECDGQHEVSSPFSPLFDDVGPYTMMDQFCWDESLSWWPGGPTSSPSHNVGTLF